MELSLFRENFARVPRHVAVLGLCKDGEIYGVTISSLQSVSVNEQQQILTFVLKKNSYFSSLLNQAKEFTINFLANNQEEISKTYSDNGRAVGNRIEETTWSRSKLNLVFVKGATFSIIATLINSIELEESDIFFVSADQIIESNEIGMLLYCERTYGAFNSWKNV